MEWPDEFGDWWDTLTEAEHVRNRRPCPQVGAARSQPAVSLFERHPQIAPCSYARVARAERRQANFYAFDPRRMAILLIGGDKTGERRFYEQMIPIADALYDQHLAELEKEKNDGR